MAGATLPAMRIEIRPATAEDVPRLAEMGRDFFAFSAFGEFADYDQSSASRSIQALRASGCVFVAVDGREIVGALIGTIAPLWFDDGARIASELAWWVNESHRHTAAGLRLYRAFEDWAGDQQASAIVMSDLVVRGGDMPAARTFERLGYTTIERSHIKRTH